jgi:type I restriction enzyme S subunit
MGMSTDTPQRPATVPPGYQQTEVGVIPDDWEIKPLVDLCFPQGLVRGPFGGSLKKEGFVETGYRVYEQRNAIYKSCDIGAYFIDHAKFTEMQRFRVEPGDFIISCSGTIGRIYQIPTDATPGIINQALLKIRTNNLVVYDQFFYLLFEWEQFQALIIDSTQGGAMQNLVGMDVFRQTPVIVPPIPEQRAIAAALSDVDGLIRSLDRLIAKKRAIKQATMQQLLTGKTRLPGFGGESAGCKQTEVGSIPEDWSLATLSNFADIRRGASPRPINSPIWYNYNSTTGWVRIADIASSDGKYLRMTQDYLSEKGIACSRYLKPGSLIMSICATVGLPIITDIPSCIHDGFVAFLELQGIHKEFLFYILKYLEPVFQSLGQTGSQNNLNTSLVRNRIIALPPLSEQRAIAAALSDVDAEIAALERRRDKTRAIKQGMMQQLLTGRKRLIEQEGTTS